MSTLAKKVLNDREICSRFLECIDQCDDTMTEVAKRIGTSKSYLSQARTKKKVRIRPEFIARVCQIYGFNPKYILLGTGKKK